METLFPPKLFTATLEEIFHGMNWEGRGININGKFLSYLCFADDIVSLDKDIEDLNKRLQELNQWSNTIGLRINIDKTKILLNNSVSLESNIERPRDREHRLICLSGTKDKHERRTKGRNQPKDTARLDGIWKNEGHS
jgi:hypothetical protein